MANSNLDLVKALDKIRFGNLYVHNDELPGASFTTSQIQSRKVYLVESLADRGTMLLFGGHGGGKTTLAKYLGQVFYQLTKEEIEDCILRGHPQLTEEKILGSLDIAQLTRAKELNSEQKVDVIWNTFVDSPWKIIDELNRLSPYAQNILLSLLAESSVKYHNESKRLPNFTLFATMNPKDEGNFIMSLPFLDRFSLALPITMPDYESLSTIGKKDKSSKQDDISTYLKNFDLKSVQDEVRELKYSDDAEMFINMIISSYRLCERISKESNENITVEKGLCDGCHFNAPEKVCNKIIHPLSVRVKEDLYRYGKALAWFLGESEVKVKHIKTLAPFIIWHRSSLSKKYKTELSKKRFEESIFSLNIELESTKEIVDKIENEFNGLLPYLIKFDKVKKGKLNQIEFGEFINDIKQPDKNFLITKKEIVPILEKEYSSVYSEIIKYNTDIERENNLDELNSLKIELSKRYDIPNRQFLADLIEKKRKTIGAESLSERIFKIPFDKFIENVKIECSELYKLVKLRFSVDFNPVSRITILLSDIGESDYNLEMERLNEGSGKYSLRFVYRGPENNFVYKFLRDKNVS